MDINYLIIQLGCRRYELFSPVSSEVIFLQKDRPDLNEYVGKNWLDLNSIVNEKRQGNLMYLPRIVSDIINCSKHLYYFPDLNDTDQPYGINEIALWEHLEVPDACKTALLFGCANDEMFICSLDAVLPSEIDCVLNAFCSFLHNYENKHCLRYSATSSFYDLLGKDAREYADDEFESEVNRLSEEIVANVNRLRSIGISEMVIKQLFDREQKLSRLVITEDYKIILPDYNNMEIQLEPLPKAVYLLFLNHPEGIRFKDLWDYRDELAQIYLNVTRRTDLHAAYQSIYNVIDSTKNSINEKCSRIKEAFVSRFDDKLASHYYITGLAGKKKGVKVKADFNF